MNIALCISGYFTNKNNDNLMETNYIHDNLINNIDKKNSLDIYIHSFDTKSENNIKKNIIIINNVLLNHKLILEKDYHHII
tara:strand:+ start:4012 stop:4254 length:243 start_codon:yes stop_codon:yes gene_type:complete